ncbi:hypothetical protein [Mesorhizobium sp. M0254]|uniref:hypothetical protein n=1 Tax=Mesorhizobium sp. M0254 TaxID=2956927 RepID=UPI00333C8351
MARFLLLLISTYVGDGTSANSRRLRRHERPVCFAFRATLARQMGVSTRTLDRWMSALKKAGLIRSVQVGRGPAEITLLRHADGEANEAQLRRSGGEANDALLRRPDGEVDEASVRHPDDEAKADLGSPSEVGLVRQQDGEHKALKAHSTPPTPSEQPINRAGDDGVSCEPSTAATDISLEQEANGAGSASPSSPRRLDSGLSASLSEATAQSQSPVAQARRSDVGSLPIVLPGRKPVLPKVEDQELYNRLTKRSPR